VDGLGLYDQQDLISNAFQIICKESLDSSTAAPPKFSRINFDGIPLQYSLALGASEPSLQFISEIRRPDSSNIANLNLSKVRIQALFALLCIDNAGFPLSDLLDEMLPENDPDLRSDHAGTIWISPSFTLNDKPKLTLYLNANWGATEKRLARLERFASYFGGEVHWRKFAALTNEQMNPLGVAVTLNGDSEPAGRIYLSTFGRRVDYFMDLARALTQCGFDTLFERYAATMLGEASRYPTQSAVCSIGAGPAADADLKIELCGHCAFTSDVDAAKRCIDWLAHMKVDPAPYLELLKILSEDQLSSTSSVVHAYTGLGVKRNRPYTSIYLKPHPTYTE
jgi:hypothetical protein